MTDDGYRFLWKLRDDLRQLQKAIDELVTRINEAYPF